MQFGRVTDQQLDSINFSLPPEPAGNSSVLHASTTAFSVYLGCPKWGSKEWIGKIYPKGTRETQFLDQYVKHYNAIELNATHYKIYKPEDIARWAAKAAGRDFKFCPKVTNSISHYSGFENTQLLTNTFLESIQAFGDHLGSIFLQVSENFHPNQRDKLFEYLTTLPAELLFFIEVRHPLWFADKTIRKELFDILKQLNMGAVITDTGGRRDCVHMELTLPKAFIRFVGNSLHPSDYSRIDEWVKRIQYWVSKGLKELYFFIHTHNEAFSPELSIYLVDELNAACNLQLKKPQFIQGSLFD